MEQERKVCRCCGRELPISSFKKGRYGHVSVCIECDTEHRREKRQERVATMLREKEEELTMKRQLRLQDFTPRELMEELKRRGYEGTLTFVETHVIDLANI